MTDLATDLEAGTAGTRELSDAVLLALGWRYEPEHLAYAWRPPVGEAPWSLERPDPTCSVDDGLALAGDKWLSVLLEAIHGMEFKLKFEPSRERLPLFICAALVRARQAAEKETEHA